MVEILAKFYKTPTAIWFIVHVKSLVLQLETVCFIILTVNSPRKSIKSQANPIKMQVLFVILLIIFVNSLLK
jgi:hypothetical protein